MDNHADGPAVPKLSDFNNCASQSPDQESNDLNRSDDLEWLSGAESASAMGLTVDQLAAQVTPYREHLNGLDLTEEQAAELLQVLYRIMMHFVDLGFDLDAISLVRHKRSAIENCAQADQKVRKESGDPLE